MKYRAEIDGVRAVAVVLVLFYHAELTVFGHKIFEGGFLGVDVFFVISGFLITNIIQKKIKENTFTFIDFYSRRARRILPTLFTVLLATLPFAWIYMKPKAIVEFSNSILSSIFFSSNINFFFEDSYTAEASFLKPLLHTWSLSLEEQFYLFFPILLILIHKFFKTRLFETLFVAALISFVTAVYSSLHNPDASFFLIHTRSWELLAGSLLAILSIRGVAPQGKAAFEKLMPGAGLLMILISAVIFDDQMQHPSFLTVLPVLGTCLILFYSRSEGWMTSLLSTRGFVGVGLISYSLYLWHAPLLAFNRIVNSSSSQMVTVGLLLLSVVLSVLSYYFVEQPFRHKHRIGTKVFTLVNLTALTVLVAFALFTLAGRGVPSRLGYLGEVLKKSMKTRLKKNYKRCGNRSLSSACVFTKPQNTGSLINIGDSHGAALAQQLYYMSNRKKLNYYDFTKSNCPYSPGINIFVQGRLYKDCVSRQGELRKFLLSIEPATLIISAKLNMYWRGETVSGSESDQHEPPGIILTTKDSPVSDVENVQKLLERNFEELLAYGHRLVLVYPVPEPGFFTLDKIKKELFPLATEAEQKKKMESLDFKFAHSNHIRRSGESFAVLNRVDGEKSQLFRIYPEEVLCPKVESSAERLCRTHNKEAAFYYDDNHLSPLAAELVVKKIEKEVFSN